MEAWAAHSGYAGLFVVSFLAATLLPLGSEAAVVTMAAAGFNATGLLTAAASGNVLGAMVNYLLGRWGRDRWKTAREAQRLHQVESWVRRWGPPVMVLAWAPVIGDPLTVAAGFLRMHWLAFLFWVSLGKTTRYWLLIAGLG